MTARRLVRIAALTAAGLWLVRFSLRAKTADLGAATAGQIACGDVDGVDLAALGAAVEDHDHAVGGSVSNATETLTITDANGNAVSVLTASTSGGLNLQNEGGYGGSGTRTHQHAYGDLVTGAITLPATLSPKTDGDILIAYANGDLTCDLIDGVAPEVLYDEYDGHYHALSGNTAYTNLASVQAYGNSGNSWFWVRPAGGGTAYWAQLTTSSGQHRHTAGTLATRAENAGSGAGVDDAGNPKWAVNPSTGAITLCGDVNGIGIAQFKAKYDAHYHAPAGATGNSGNYSARAQLWDGASDVEALKNGTTWIRIYIDAGTHNHGGSGLSIGTPT